MRPVIFWDADTQHDFMSPSGKLFVRKADEIRSDLARLTARARDAGITVVASVDDHRLEDPEIALKNPDFRTTLPPHCLRGTPGQAKIPETRPSDPLEVDSRAYPEGELEKLVRGGREIVIRKQALDVFTNPNTERIVSALDPVDVIVFGVAPGAGDRFAVEGLLARGRRVHLVLDAFRAFHPEEGDRLVSGWRSRGVALATAGEVVDGGYVDSLREKDGTA
jgi:nicotinamidase/pyrazinamidase